MNEPPLVPPLGSSTTDFAVAGIGASAGGIEALQTLFRKLPADAGIVYVVVVHLSPDHESQIAQILRDVTSMPVMQVTETVRIVPDQVYVISPRSELRIHDGKLEPTHAETRPSRPITIDVFFETLAEAHKHRSFAVVLSGTGTDGTRGVRAVKALGGVTFAQAPNDAQYDGMPQSAIASGGVDFVLPVADLASKLIATWHNARAITVPVLPEHTSPEDAVAKAEQSTRDILATLRARTGHDFSQYKRATVLRRFERRLQVNHLRDLGAYGHFVSESARETDALLNDLLINVTGFFRDPEVFEYLEAEVVPLLFEGRDEGSRIRIWVPGCATGEEAYSFAMLFAEHAQRLAAPPTISVFATDISEEALSIARAGVYPESSAEQLTRERLRRWFTTEKGMLRVQKQLRELVMFAPHNVLQDAPFSHLDLVSCRNLLIYLNRPAQSKVLDLLHFALRPDGFLVLGMSESIDVTHDGFRVVDKARNIFSQQATPRAGLTFAPVPLISQHRVSKDVVSASGRRLVSSAELHLRLLEHYAPPSVIVDERYEIVHLSDTAHRYFQFGPGEPSFSIVKSSPEGLRYEIKAALDEAMQGMCTVERKHLPLRRGPETVQMNVRVHPVRDRATMRTFALVLLDEDTRQAEVLETDGTQSHAGATAVLEDRLQDMQWQLRGAVEQYEVQNEELKASNEELQAANEELRATTEELETGKEELQSINEELSTVNAELKNKVDETTRVTDDLQNFIVATGIAALFVDRDLRLMRYTPFARDIFNVILGDVGRPLLDITHRLKGIDFVRSIGELLESLQPVEQEVQSIEGRWYIVRFLPYRTVDDRIGGAVVTFIDITHRRRSEASRRRGEAWARVVFESVRDYAIMTLDSAGLVQTWNVGAEEIFGYTSSEMLGQSFARLFTPEDRDAGTPEAELQTATRAGRADDERWQLRKDGTRFYASGVCAPLVEAEAFGFVKILRDLTQHQLAEQRRDELHAMERAHRAAAEEASRVKDEFLATLSHEMRNPLALIQMQSELLLRAPETRSTPRLASAAEIIHQTVKAQAQFVDDMLDVSRLRTGKLAVERQLLPLPLIVADSIGGLREEAEKNNITLDIEIDAEPMIVEADVVRVKQIAWNLLSNAIKFTPHGGNITVRLKRENAYARLDVEDDGQGIAPDVLPHIFDWFRQAESGSTRRKGGMGIGLALVKQLVELHGGRVAGHSRGIGKGACFSVWLPLQNAATQVGATPATASPLDVPEAAGRLAGVRILIIDDLADNAAAMSDLLKFEGADAALEVTAHDAIKRAMNESFDVIISDLAMPEMDGYTMLEKLRRSPRNAHTPAIAYSGYGGAEEMARSKKSGFALHLTKPVDVERLFSAIESVLADSRSDHRGRSTAEDAESKEDKPSR